MKKGIIFLLIMLVVLSLCACGQSDFEVQENQSATSSVDEVANAKGNLKKAYELYGNQDLGFALNRDLEYATLSTDGCTLQIDTKPDNLSFYINEDEGLIFDAINDINNYLGLPSSLMPKIENTRAIDGMMTEKSGLYIITWNYHPDDGLEIIYEVNQ